MQAGQIKPGQQGWLQTSVQSLGSYAQTSTPAYTLAALFALSTPFGFASPAQAAAEAAAKLQRQQQYAQASAAASSSGSSSLVARIVANAQSQRAAAAQTHSVRTLPPFWQLAFFAAAFGTGGYMIDQGDALNGSGVVTAWSLTYLLFKTAPSVRQLPRNPLAMALSLGVLTAGFGVHGSHYFDRTSWRGAIPALNNGDADANTPARSRLVSFDTVGSTNQQSNAPASIFAKTAPSPASPKPSADNRIQQVENAITGSNGHNNDVARTAAFLHRQGGNGSGRIVA